MPNLAEYTKWYKLTNDTGEDQCGVLVTLWGADWIPESYADPTAWAEAEVSYVWRSGVICTQLVFFDDGTSVGDGDHVYIAWKTWDNDCYTVELRWIGCDRTPGDVAMPDEMGGQSAPGGGGLLYDPDTDALTILVINYSSDAISLADTNVQLMESAVPLDRVCGLCHEELDGPSIADHPAAPQDPIHGRPPEGFAYVTEDGHPPEQLSPGEYTTFIVKGFGEESGNNVVLWQGQVRNRAGELVFCWGEQAVAQAPTRLPRPAS